MNKAILATGLLAALAAVPAQGAAPYPPSTAIIGLTRDTSTYQYGGLGADIWPITWASDGSLRAAYGDGQINCPAKVSYGVVAITSEAPGTAMQGVHCGPTGHGKGKIMALGAAGSSLFAVVAPQGTASGFPIMRSTDDGRSWATGWSPSWMAESFINFGRGNAGAPDGHVYMVDGGATTVKLVRFPADRWADSSAYQYFSGSATAPAWSSKRGASKAVFTDAAGVQQPTLQYVPGLDRYLLIAAHTGPGKIGVFESEKMWGPWRTVHYTENWLGLGTRGKYYSIYFPLKWQSSDGRTLWATFSCHNARESGACGQYHDRFNLIRVTLALGGAKP